jgi:hypothetical protein
MTQAELIHALKKRGYPEVTPRVLTDWRAKRLLPPLARRGNGQGHGAHQFWKQPDILDRAVAVCEFMRQHRRVKTTILKLWFARFDVESELVREAWLQGLGRSSNWIKRNSEWRLEPEAVFSNMAFAATKKSAFGIDRHIATEALAEFLHAYFGDSYKLELEAVFEPVAAMLAGSLTGKNPTLGIPEAMSGSNVEAFFSLMKNVLSLGAKRRLIVSTTNAELARAHNIWVRIIDVSSSFVRMTGINLFGPTSPDRYAPAIAFGGLIIHAILLANRLGMNERIRKSLRIIEDILDRNIVSHRIFEKGTNPLDVYSEGEVESIQEQWKFIWDGTDFSKILNRLIRDKTLQRVNNYNLSFLDFAGPAYAKTFENDKQ